MSHPSNSNPPGRASRRRRSTWYQLLTTLDGREQPRRAPLADLVGATQEVMCLWIEAAEPMPLARQWQMAVVADALYGSDPSVHRLAQTLRSELEARAAYLSRGRVSTSATPEMYR